MKQPLRNIEARPSKRIYLSIIADYHLKTALCELIDNAIDNWRLEGRKHRLIVSINLDYQQQVIKVTDNSGGIKEDEISMIVSPGFSRNTAEDDTIGIFGVGSKRAVVALAKEIKIYTRYRKGNTLLVEIDDDWIENDDTWDLPVYTVANIPENTTIIELVKLRDPIKQDDEAALQKHLGASYSLFLQGYAFDLLLNVQKIEPVIFDKWSYPPDFEPRKYQGGIDFGEKGKINLEILGGLTILHKG